MTKIEVKITKNAEKDMMLIYEYILNDLKSPQTALKYFNQLASSINSLNLIPSLINSLTIGHLSGNKFKLFMDDANWLKYFDAV